MRNKFVIPVLFLALVAVTGWGYSQFQMRRQWEISAENQYQRSYEELTAHVNNMETAMSKALVASSYPQSISLLTSIWREANSSQENLGQLPLTSLELNRTKTHLAKVSTFSYNAVQNRLLKGGRGTETEWKNLSGLRDQTRVVSKHLLNLRQQFFTNRTRWLEVDRLGTLGAAGAAASLNSNQVTKAFLMLEDGLRRVPDVQFQGNNLDFVPKPTGLSGNNITARDAVEVARKFLGAENKTANLQYERLIKGNFPSYMIRATGPRNTNQDRRLSVSVKGGHVAWMLGNRPVAKSSLSLTQAEDRAKAFLSRNGYTNMRGVGREHFSNIATISFVPVRDGVLYYPELVKVQVAQDNGEILGFDSTAYLTFHDSRETQPGSAKITEAQIRKMINPHLRTERVQLAQVLDEMYNKVLCYEVQGTQGPDRYLIYYNATSGKEEKIRRIDANGNEVQ